MLTVLSLVIAATCFGEAARILFVAPTPSYSHQVVFQPIWKELSLRGHQVTVITTNPLKDPKLNNLTEISVEFVYSLVEVKYKFSAILDTLKDETFKYTKFIYEIFSRIYQEELSNLQVQRLIKDPQAKFDVVIVEFLLPTMVAFGHRFKCPIIGITSLEGNTLNFDIMGNPAHPILNPEHTLHFVDNLTIFEKVYSIIYAVACKVGFIFTLQMEDQVVAEYFGPGYPPLREMVKKVEMYFINANPAFHSVRPTVPGIIHIGGSMHIRPPGVLPDDLQKFLDDSEDGVIYFSMGTNVRTKFLPEKFKTVMLQAFSALPYRILWKMDEGDFPGVPENVRIETWVSQQDVLRHPKVKAFITQGGLQSLEEAINLKKPVVCIPYFGDQFSNCIQAYNKGMGVVLDRRKITSAIAKAAIAEVAENEKYLNAVKKLCEISSDQPMTGLEKAVWWTEYVIRHGGAKHLRSKAADMPLYEYLLLDVLGFIFGSLLCALFIFAAIAKLTIRAISSSIRPKKVVTGKEKDKTS